MFGGPVSLAAPAGPDAVVTADFNEDFKEDFNGDGKLDFVGTNYNTGVLELFLHK
jgi:hypothetical protein